MDYRLDRTLIDKDDIPTSDELRQYFLKNDYTFSSGPFDPQHGTNAQNELYNKARGFFFDGWCKNLKKFGCKTKLKSFSKDYPIHVIQKADEKLIAGGVVEVFEHPEVVQQIFDAFFSQLEAPLNLAFSEYAKSQNKKTEDITDEEALFVIDKVADAFLETMEELMMKSQGIPELLGILKEVPTHEDFNQNMINNNAKIDFERQWDHTRTLVGRVLGFGELAPEELESISAEEERSEPTDDELNQIVEDFVLTLDDSVDREIIRMKMQQMTQSEIAMALGYKSQSAVSKRLEKLKPTFTEFLRKRAS